MHIKTDAIVLRAYDNGKNSKLLLLLTREYGRLAVTARGAGSLKSALCAASGQFCYASFVLFKNADRYVVESADIKELFFELRQDVAALACAQYMAELAGAVAQEGEGDEELLRVLLNCLYGMAKLKLAPALCKCVFELRMALCEGYMPDLDCESASIWCRDGRWPRREIRFLPSRQPQSIRWLRFCCCRPSGFSPLRPRPKRRPSWPDLPSGICWCRPICTPKLLIF